MRNYIYIPTWRKLWLDLAIKLDDNKIATPSLWISDDKYINQINKKFNECEFINFRKINKWEYENIWLKTNINNYSLYSIINRTDFREFKEKTINMMNRQDMYWLYRNIDRDAIFYSILSYLFNTIWSKKIDFSIFSESPHSPATFITYYLCKHFWIKTYMFSSCSIAPVIFLKDWIDWNFLSIPKHIKLETNLKEYINNEIESFNNKFSQNDNKNFEPKYMINQKKEDTKKISKLIKYIKWVFYTLAWYNNNTYFFSISWINKKITFIDWIITFILRKKYEKNLNENLDNKSVKNVNLDDKYVYFPLHYEPERTSNPDWWDFFNQIDALIALRSKLPSDIKIYVKEHYSQLTSTLQWFRSRSKYFYDIINSLESIILINVNFNSRKLIKNSLFTCTLTWTATLEACFLWKSWFFMWHPWFEKIKWLNRFQNDKELNLTEIQKNKIEPIEIISHIKTFIEENWIFWTINPSNEKYYSSYYLNNDINNIESEQILELITNNIINEK